MPENEMPDYIQEEDEEEDPFYFVQPQQRSHGNIYLAASVGDIDRVRCCFFTIDQLMENKCRTHQSCISWSKQCGLVLYQILVAIFISNLNSSPSCFT